MGSKARIIIDQKKLRGRGRVGCLLRLIPLTIAGILCVKFILYPLMITGFGSADTRPVPGEASSFDPIASMADIRAYAGEGAQLVSIDANYVRSDGTMELTAEYSPSPYVEYDFMREVPRPADAPPIGAGGANTDPWYEPIEITASQPGKWWTVSSSSSEYSYMNQGMERETSRARNGLSGAIVPDPVCSFAELWAVALKKDAPASAVAIIEYNEYGYDFSISGLSVDLNFDMECRLIRENGNLVEPTPASP